MQIVAHDDVDLGCLPFGVVQCDGAVIVGVAFKGVVAVHSGKDAGSAVKAKEAEGLVNGMRSCVEQATAPVFLTGLPVPAPRKTAPGGSDVHDFAQYARVDDFLYFVKVGLQAVVLKGGKNAVVVAGGLNDVVELRHGFAGGFFAYDMGTRLESGNAGDGMQGLVQGIDKEVKSTRFDHVLPVLVCFGSKLFAGIAPALGQLIGYGYNFEFVGHLAQLFGVDVISTAPLTADGDANDVVVGHVRSFVSWGFGISV